MENLVTALKSKKLEDLVATKVAKETTLIEPTQAEVEEIITALKEGKSFGEIKKTIRRVVKKEGKQISAKGFSYGQIKEIDLGRNAKIVELTPCTVCGKAPCTCPKPEPVVVIEPELTK